MQLLRKYKFEIIFFFLSAIIFFSLRLFRIDSLPLFTDEAIYTRWSQIARYDAAWRFISLTDGKQPLFIWLDMTFMRFIQDPLIAGRAVSVVAGFFSMIGLFFLGKEIFKNKFVGFISAILYLIYPFALVYDRMALYDSLVGALMIWCLYFEILLIRRMNFYLSFVLALILGAAILTKTSGFFAIYLLPFSLLLFDLNKKDIKNRFIKWIGFALISVVLAYVYYSVLRLSPFFHIIGEKNSIFVYPLNDWINHPLRFFWGNLLGLWDWFLNYTTWPLIILMVSSFIFYRSYTKEKLLLLAWFVIPFVALALFGRVLYPRFIFFMTLPLLPLGALSIYKLNELVKNKIIFSLCFFALTFFIFKSNYFILTDFSRAPIPGSDLEQYINGWPAGGGVKEIMSFLGKQASNGKIYVATEGTFGSLPTYGVEIYLGDNKNVEKQGMWPVPIEIPKELLEKAKKMPVYIVFNTTQDKPNNWPLKFISKYQKGVGNSYMSIYQVETK